MLLTATTPPAHLLSLGQASTDERRRHPLLLLLLLLLLCLRLLLHLWEACRAGCASGGRAGLLGLLWGVAGGGRVLPLPGYQVPSCLLMGRHSAQPLPSLPLQQLLLADQALHFQLLNSSCLRCSHPALQLAAGAERLVACLLACRRGPSSRRTHMRQELLAEADALRAELRRRGRHSRLLLW